MEGRPIYTRVGRHFGIGVVGPGEGKGLVTGLHRHPDLRVVTVCDTEFRAGGRDGPTLRHAPPQR